MCARERTAPRLIDRNPIISWQSNPVTPLSGLCQL
jgi:hypothetical protein